MNTFIDICGLIIVLKEQGESFNKYYDRVDDLCKNINEKNIKSKVKLEELDLQTKKESCIKHYKCSY